MKTMKKLIAVILTLAAVIMGAAALAEGKGDILIATGKCNLRQEADLDSGILAIIHKGDKLTRTGEWKYDIRGVRWYRVTTAGGKTGWASSVYLHYANEKMCLIETTARLNIRFAASEKAESIGIIGKGIAVTGTDAARDANGRLWYLITYAGKTGWISADYAREI